MITPNQLARREYKCLVDEDTVERIRRYMRGICEVDPYARQSAGRYVIDTLYLDTPALETYWATVEDRGDRYKLRIRGYPSADRAPVFFEVKRRVGDTIKKSRGSVSGDWTRVLRDLDAVHSLEPKQRQAVDNFLCHYLTRPMLPVVLVRYEREPYFSVVDDYARVTFDRCLSYQPASDLSLVPAHDGWTAIDSAEAQRGVSFAASTVLVELKFTNLAPAWMRRMVQTLDLQRLSFCKYTRAIESLRYVSPGRVARGGLVH